MKTKLVLMSTFGGALVAAFLLADKDTGQTNEDSQYVAESTLRESASAGSTAASRVPTEVPNGATNKDDTKNSKIMFHQLQKTPLNLLSGRMEWRI